MILLIKKTSRTETLLALPLKITNNFCEFSQILAKILQVNFLIHMYLIELFYKMELVNPIFKPVGVKMFSCLTYISPFISQPWQMR